MYKVSFYTSLGKTSPIQEFLDSCQFPLRAKIIRQLKYVEEFGLTKDVPNLRKITGTPLWELRILGKDNVRIFCVSTPDRVVKVLHIFKKKKQKTPLGEIKLAMKRYKEILDK